MLGLTRGGLVGVRRLAPWKQQNFINLDSPIVRRMLSSAIADQDLDGQDFDAVIIGGGVIGCSTLYHLAKLGVTNTLLVERNKLTSGTTWHSNGLAWSLRPSDVDVQLLGSSINLFQRLEEETGVSTGWKQNGGLFIASTKERLDEYQRLRTLGRVFGVESHVLGPDETRSMWPLIHVDDVYGTLHSPMDGSVDPNGLCAGLVRFAKDEGAKLVEDCPVLDVLTEETNGKGRVKGVKTTRGTIKTKRVVNCTGSWANYISNMVGLDTPLVTLKHSYVTTDRVEGIDSYPNIRDHDSSVVLKQLGSAWHFGGYENNPEFVKDLPADFAFGLYELDWDMFDDHVQGCVHRVPSLAKVGIKSTVYGPESFTPDHRPILGEHPGLRGFFQGCGFNSSGIMYGGGCGEQLAHWIVHGRPQLDMYNYSVRRFCPEVSSNVRWQEERSHEAYVTNYSIIFPQDEPLAGRNMKKDSLHEEMKQAGCVFQERVGWERPGWFASDGVGTASSASSSASASASAAEVRPYDWHGVYGHEKHEGYAYRENLHRDFTFGRPGLHETLKKECWSTRQNVAVFNMSSSGKFLLSGPEAKTAVHWLMASRVNQSPDSVTQSLMLNQRAGIEGYVTVTTVEDGKGPSYLITDPGDTPYHVQCHIDQAIQEKGFQAVLSDQSRQFGILSIQGPQSRHLLSLLTDSDLSEQAFPNNTHRLIKVAGCQTRMLRTTLTGELGWELHVPWDSCPEVFAALHQAGRPLGLANAGYRALDSLRLEAGHPSWGQDIRLDDTPLEAGLLDECKLDSELEFLGQSSLLEKVKNGPTRKRVFFSLEDREADCYLLGLEAIYRDGQPVGYLRRAEFAHSLLEGQTLGCGYVQSTEVITDNWLLQGGYEIECLGVKHSAKIHLKAPYIPLSSVDVPYQKNEEYN